MKFSLIKISKGSAIKPSLIVTFASYGGCLRTRGEVCVRLCKLSSCLVQVGERNPKRAERLFHVDDLMAG